MGHWKYKQEQAKEKMKKAQEVEPEKGVAARPGKDWVKRGGWIGQALEWAGPRVLDE